jgi:hypothetical protein
MTRQLHDQFAKQYLEELLTPLGTVNVSWEIPSEVRQVDIWFVPQASTPSVPNLGLLQKLAATSCLFEPYRNPPTEIEMRSCLLKLYSLHGNLIRKAKRDKHSLIESELPCLWILSPSCSQRILNGFGATIDQLGNWGNGVYFLPEFQKTAIVAINQLPATPDTLWLRILGKGRTQQRAVEELVNLPTGTPLLEELLDILANWRKNLELRDNLNEDEREVFMNLAPAYLRQREEWREEGKQEERREMVENFLKVRFETVDESLSRIIDSMLQLPTEELTRLLLTLEREELLARFSDN